MKTVIDCNILISAGINDGICREVIKEIITKHNNFISQEILLDYREVILRPKFIKYKSTLISLVELICEYSSDITINNYNMGYSLPDISDEIYLKTALKSQAEYLVTGNIKDFPQINYGKIKVLSPKDFLELI